MLCEFYKDGNFIEDCEQTNIPRAGDSIIIDKTKYDVISVVWNYDTRVICINVDGVN